MTSAITRVIANPPMGIYKGDIHIGQAFYHVLLDVYSRFLTKYTSTKVVFPAYSLNTYGKRADSLAPKAGTQSLKEFLDANAADYISTSRLRDRLNLQSGEVLLDNNQNSAKSAQDSFSELVRQGFAFNYLRQWFLDAPKISRRFDLKQIARTIACYPSRTAGELERLIDENTKKPTLITRPTLYSAQNPCGGENLGPLFVLATMWEGNYPNAQFTIAASNNTLAKYVFLRFLIQNALNGNPGMDELFIYNRIEPEGGTDNWDINNLTKNSFEADMLRYALISGHSLTKQKVALNKALLHGGRNFVYLFGSLRKAFGGIVANTNPKPDENYQKLMKSFRFGSVLQSLEKKIRGISKKINQSKREGTWEQEKINLSTDYLSAAHQLSPMLPAISELAINEFKGD